MLARYAAGESLSALGRAYGCDHTTIYNQVYKAGIHRAKAPTLPLPKISQASWDYAKKMMRCCGSKSNRRHLSSCVHFTPEFTRHVNVGKTYADYLRDEDMRRAKRFRCFSKAVLYGIPTIPRDLERIEEQSSESPNQDPVPAL